MYTRKFHIGNASAGWAQPGIMGWNLAYVILEQVCITWNPLGQLPSFLGATGLGVKSRNSQA